MASFGGFGSTTPSFGATNTQTSAGTLFGGSAATSTPSNTNLLSNNTSAGTLFGANTSNSSSAGTLFGGSATNTTTSTGFGGFGTQPATSNAFGTTTPASNTTGGFGTGFGATSQPVTGGFGSTATSQPAATGFGATTTNTTGFGTGFGATSQPATTGFGFGATSQPAANTGFGGFGSTATTGSFGGFGSTSAAPVSTAGGFSGFGNTATAAKPAFGTMNNNNTSLFGANKTTGFGTQPSTGFGMQQQQQQQQQQVQEKVWQDLALIRAHFDPTSPLCQFRHYFYNMVPENEVHLYVRPQNQDEQLWNEAMRRNPDPKKFVPVLAIGFDDILKRMEVQSNQAELHQEKLKETSERLQSVQRQYMLGTLVKLEEHKRRHTDLTQRLLRLLRYSSVLRYKGFPLNTDEEATIQQLAQLAESNESPEQLNVKMIALWNRLQSLKAQTSQDRDSKYEVWRTVSEEDTNIIAKVLSDEHHGIKHITSILKSDGKELEAIEDGLKECRNTFKRQAQ